MLVLICSSQSKSSSHKEKKLLAVLIGVRMLNFLQEQLQIPTEKKFL